MGNQGFKTGSPQRKWHNGRGIYGSVFDFRDFQLKRHYLRCILIDAGFSYDASLWIASAVRRDRILKMGLYGVHNDSILRERMIEIVIEVSDLIQKTHHMDMTTISPFTSGANDITFSMTIADPIILGDEE
jgi:hypothetical protein